MPYVGQTITEVFPTSVSLDTVTATTSLKTPLVEFTDGDNAFEISDGGNVAFSGTVSGASSGLVKLLSTTISNVAQYDITDTYINATYDEYVIYAGLLPASDGVNLDCAAFITNDTYASPELVTGTLHSFQSYSPDGGGVSTDTDCTLFFRPNKYTIGNVSGESVRFEGTIQNVNSTTQPYCIHGQFNHGITGGTMVGGIFFGSAQKGSKANLLRGLRIVFGSGNIASGYIKLYGVTK